MMKYPLISIIVPVYNVKQYLDKCMISILGQSYRKLEIILVDDGSTDGSGEIADKYKKKYKNVRVIHKANGGLSSARNEGIRHSSGEWLVFIDSDDYVDSDFVKDLYELTQGKDVDIATCSFESFSDDDSILKRPPSWPTVNLTGREAINDAFKNKRPAYICLSMFRADFFRKDGVEFPDGREYEDVATRIRLLFFARKVAFTNKKNYKYLIRGTSITGKKFSKTRYRDFLFALDSVKEFLARQGAENDFEYLRYFEFYSLFTLLNYIARESEVHSDTKKCWDEIRRKLKTMYVKVKFPSLKTRMLYTTLLFLTSSRVLYSLLYRKAKK